MDTRVKGFGDESYVVGKHEHNLRKQEDMNESLKKENFDLKMRVDQLQEELDGYRQHGNGFSVVNADKLKEENLELTRDKKHLEDVLLKSRSALRSLGRDRDEAKKHAESLLAQVAELQQQLAAERTRFEEVVQHSEVLREEYERHVEIVRTLQTEVEAKGDEVAQLRDMMSEADAQRRESVGKSVSVEEHTMVKRLVAQLEGELRKKQGEVEELERVRGRMDAQTFESSRMSAWVQQQQHADSELRTQLRHTEGELVRMRERVRASEACEDGLRMRVRDAEREVEQLRGARRTADVAGQQHVQHAAAIVGALVAQLDALAGGVGGVAGAGAAAEAAARLLTTDAHALQQDVAVKMARVRDLLATRAQLPMAKEQEWAARCAAMQQVADAKAAEASAAMAREQHARAELARCVAELKSVEESRAETQRQNEALVQRVRDAEQDKETSSAAGVELEILQALTKQLHMQWEAQSRRATELKSVLTAILTSLQQESAGNPHVLQLLEQNRGILMRLEGGASVHVDNHHHTQTHHHEVHQRTATQVHHHEAAAAPAPAPVPVPAPAAAADGTLFSQVMQVKRLMDTLSKGGNAPAKKAAAPAAKKDASTDTAAAKPTPVVATPAVATPGLNLAQEVAQALGSIVSLCERNGVAVPRVGSPHATPAMTAAPVFAAPAADAHAHARHAMDAESELVHIGRLSVDPAHADHAIHKLRNAITA